MKLWVALILMLSTACHSYSEPKLPKQKTEKPGVKAPPTAYGNKIV